MKTWYMYGFRVMLIGIVAFSAVQTTGQQSAAAEDEISRYTRVLVDLGLNPFLAAVVESDARGCIALNATTPDGLDCVQMGLRSRGVQLSTELFAALRLVKERQRNLDGQWITFSNFRGRTTRGSVVIAGRTGTYRAGSDTGAFTFYQTTTTDEWAFSYTTSYNDVGVGWLHMSDDACSMWGSFYSNAQSDGGRFLMARC